MLTWGLAAAKAEKELCDASGTGRRYPAARHLQVCTLPLCSAVHVLRRISEDVVQFQLLHVRSLRAQDCPQ